MNSDSERNPHNPKPPSDCDQTGSASNRREFLRGISAIDAIRRESEEANQNKENSETTNSFSRDRQSGYLEYYSKNAMACEFEVYFNLHQYRNSGMATMDAFQLIDLLEDQLTIYRDHSELSEINREAFENNVRVESRLFELLSLAHTIFRETEGAFDITSGPLTRLWGFEKRNGNLPDPTKIEKLLPTIGSNHFNLRETDSTISFELPNLMLNLGGIGKGHALDRVKEMFAERELENYVIHGGQSSVIANGNSIHIDASELQSASDSQKATSTLNPGWTVGISHPTLPGQRLAEVYLRNQALGTSGTARQGFYHQGKRYGHIIDPRTGWPSERYLSTTVISQSAAVSDALATGFFVMPHESIKTYCDNHPEVGAIIVSENPAAKSRVAIETFNLTKDSWKRLN
tara:strand:- start:1112 stop:2323 length:1212 start_codon:yes stop_codon:yes gene_type:complete